jgi:sulfur-oxidizing protein SoxZ
MVGDRAEVKVLMAHDMETGQRKDSAGQLVPAKYIERVEVTWKDKVMLSADWGPSVSKNPYLAFRFSGAAKGDTIKVAWVDTSGDTRTDEAVIG